MDQLIDYSRIVEYLKQRRGLQSVGIQIEYHRIWLDNTKAKFLRDWRLGYGLEPSTFDDPRKI